MQPDQPTPVPDLNAVLQDFVTSIQAILGANFLAAYLQGSFAMGDWDVDSDVDFLVAIDRDVSAPDLAALQAMHGTIYDLPSPWAQHLEGSYVPGDILRRAGTTKPPLLFLDNTSRELVWSTHDNTQVVRWVVREYGITLAGVDASDLIDPVSSDDLRSEVLETMNEWAQQLFAKPSDMDNRWCQPFAVVSYCRMLHTLETGRIASKPAGAKWALGALDNYWAGLIRRACNDRPNPSLKVRQKADPDDLQATIAFIRYALEIGTKMRQTGWQTALAGTETST